MEKLDIKLKNCYGIKELNKEFSFKKSNVNLIYAKNGSMKTSFAKTFQKIQDGKKHEIRDEIFDLPGEIDIKIDGVNIKYDDIYVIKSINHSINPNISNLLVKKDLKNKYDLLNNGIKNKLENLIQKLNTKYGTRNNNLIPIILNDFLLDKNTHFIDFIRGFIDSEIEIDLSYIKYNDFLNDSKVIDLLENPGFKDNIKKYNDEYSKILNDKANCFVEGVFTPFHAFRLKDKIKKENLYGGINNGIILGNKPFKTYDELNNEISNILETIQKDEKLAFIKEKIEKGAKPLQKFNELFEKKSDEILYGLKSGINNFKQLIWKSYFFELNDKIKDLINEYDDSIKEISKIQEEAKIEKTEWFKIIKEFENKFHTPFEIGIEDVTNSILGGVEPVIIFKYFNKETGKFIKSLKKDDLINKNVLSGGENKVLYLLFILFDIKLKEKEGKNTLFIIDDIAESFDYKNKYAIIEYLKYISKNPNFRMILLSHNFDFYRALSLRLDMKRENKFHIISKGNGIEIKQEIYQKKHPFEHWKDNLKDENFIISLIPFVRNIIQFGHDKEKNTYNGIKKDFLLLTNLLHIKKETKKINFGILKRIYEEYIGKNNFNISICDIDLIYDKIIYLANKISYNDINLENKIILAIAIRFNAEEFMIDKINNNTFTEGISENQTRVLFEEVIKQNLCNNGEINILEQVNIMTPENIHLNSFMYEPILDMDIIELKDLYEKVKKLN